ncbi:uncharacterized protein C5orf52 homolog [Dasypus novemcinctus]|uniref:uncharacterized protein C5orf52 homolog n=1 Tax=Dasypus novemcinctus TaxID=9361 RepID=UPI00032888AD|nr:uncharacterized protein C5orf52 homolog [Dasypus novemcinctus]
MAAARSSSDLLPIHRQNASAEPPAGEHPPRQSVTWDPNSPMAFAATAQPSTSYGTNLVPTPARTSTPTSLQRSTRSGSVDMVLGVRPQIIFLRPRTAQTPVLFSLMNSSEAAVKKLLPKSHLSRVIIRDNLSAQRILEIEIRASDKTKKKMGHLFDHLKKKFLTDQLRKLGRWRREFASIQQYLDSTRAYKFQLKFKLDKSHAP